jgi:hypothetical protein
MWIGAPMPPEYAALEAEWLRLNPGWTVRHWGEAEIADLDMVNRRLYERAPRLTPERFVPRFRANLARYEILLRHGGVWADCDLVPLAPLPDLPSAFAGWEVQGEWIGNTIMGCEPGHPFFARLVDGAAESVRQHRGKRSPVSTGPQYVTRTYKGDDRWQTGPDALHLFDERTFYPQGWRSAVAGDEPDLDGAVTHHLWTALRGQVSVVIPYRSDGGERDRSLAWLLTKLEAEHPDWQVHVVTDDGDGPFNRAALLRRGVTEVCGDIIVAHDADCWCPDLPEAVRQVQQGRSWVVPHTMVHRLSPESSARFMDGAALEGLPLSTDNPQDSRPYRGVVGGGVVVLTRSAFHQTPPDPRFAGWGGEDEAWGYALAAAVGKAARMGGPLVHLWHPPQPRQSRVVGNEENQALLRRYRKAKGHRQSMRRLAKEVQAWNP